MINESINQFSFAGKKSYDDMGLIITETPVVSCPQRDVEYIGISGCSGDILADNGRYLNTNISYKVAVLSDDSNVEVSLRKVRAWLARNIGYQILSDTYDPGYFRYAAVSGEIEFTQTLRAIGAGTIKFNCKPFRYSLEGQQLITITGESTLNNPEAFESAPHIKVIGSGNITLYVNNKAFAISSVDENIELDSEIMAAYKGTALQNNKTNFVDFPRFVPGDNSISWAGNVTKIEVTPRWCTL